MSASFLKQILRFFSITAFVLSIGCQTNDPLVNSPLQIAISFTEGQSAEPLDGRMLLLISKNN